ncbi:hypothetical protein KDA_65310 [Dictyobacter alpinus]|uniref:Uncharacterized protein n=1 Tax=Dictyobacter alpinus TaxID=2014873 RepID=A0A402BIG9_9CHLR|nr:hypothetical protein KDA_65310 [Dictyobacter alpinus]
MDSESKQGSIITRIWGKGWAEIDAASRSRGANICHRKMKIDKGTANAYSFTNC